MSQLGNISQQYEDISTLLKAVNSSVTLLKKHELSGSRLIKEEGKLQEARQLLADVLDRLITKKPSSVRKARRRELVAIGVREAPFPTFQDTEYELDISLDEEESLYVPLPFIRSFWKKLNGASHSYEEKLPKFRSILIEKQPLSDELIKLLDTLCIELDTQAAAIHRNMWRM